MTCKELAELVTDYLDGALPVRERLAFDRHIALCPDCGRYLEQMRHAVTTLGRLPPEPIPPDVEAKLLAQFRDWKRERARK
ncbi:MAG: anti-sigma factor family protein [Myxococcota bacterium]